MQAECTLSTQLAKDFVEHLLIGANLNAGIDKIVEKFELNYVGDAKNAIIKSIRSIYQRYQNYNPRIDDKVRK